MAELAQKGSSEKLVFLVVFFPNYIYLILIFFFFKSIQGSGT